VEQFGAEATAALLQRNNEEARVILRPWGLVREQLEASLERSGVTPGEVPLVPDSLQLPQGTALLELAAWRQGHCFVQDPAATLVTRYASFPAGSIVGDLCAAPGGKALELSRTARFVVAADRSPSRLSRLAANLTRLGAPDVALMAMDAAVPSIARLDAILLDVPCTGTGTFRRHPDARWRLRHSDLALLAASQAGLLRAGAECVKPGGLLVYSTCSLPLGANDDQVDAFLSGNEVGPRTAAAGCGSDDVLDRGLRVLRTGTAPTVRRGPLRGRA
jgi:16S rRNA (cytosine967-C5)-methyltransferase